MSETGSMVEIIPAGERGSFTITAPQLMNTHSVSLEAFEVLLREEALRRGLALNVTENLRDGSMTVKWRPES